MKLDMQDYQAHLRIGLWAKGVSLSSFLKIV